MLSKYKTNKIGIDIFPELTIENSRMDTLFHNEEFYLGIECIEKSVKKNPFSVDSQGRLKSGNQLYSIYKGKVKWDIILEAENKKTRIPFKVEKTKGINFYLQLNGSIAVYCNKANHVIGKTNYKTGKLLHIGQIILIDQKGNTALGHYEFTEYGFDMVLPDEFVRNSKGYILVDPDFGYTSIGASAGYFYPSDQPQGSIYGSYTASTGDTLTQITAYANYVTAASVLNTALYSITSNELVSRLGTANAITVSNGTGAWVNTGTISQSMSNGVEYGMAWDTYGEASDGVAVYYDDSAAQTKRHDTAEPLPATWSNLTTISRTYSVYATYTTGGGGSILPILTANRRRIIS